MVIIDDSGYAVDLKTKLLEKRIIFIQGEIDTDYANDIKSQLIYLNDISSDDIKIYIDSVGGSIYTSLGIIDTMEWIDCDIQTVNIGLAASMGAVILASGTKGKRMSLKRSRTMIHQPIGFSGFAQASDIQIDAKQIGDVKKELYKILSDNTGQTFDKVSEDADRDYWMNAKEAKNYGIIDKIIKKNSK